MKTIAIKLKPRLTYRVWSVGLATSFSAILLAPSGALGEATHAPAKVPTKLPQSFYIDGTYNRVVVRKVDDAIANKLYSKKLAQTVWKDALKKNFANIVSSRNMQELSSSMGAVFAELHTSHCNFVTTNDEMYYFLHALFGDFNRKLRKGKVDYVGCFIGGQPFERNQVRYILDGSPAAKAGLQIGDRVLKVNDTDYVGYTNFLGTAGTKSSILIERNGVTKTLSIKPGKEDLYSAYCDATRNSVKIEEINGKKIGYIHVWSGGRRSFEALDEMMEEKLADTDGLIFDMRDGYGGNSLSDLDRFYRDPKAYPDFVTVGRDGKKNTSRYYYDKPMVAIINGGSRSGKELLSFSLKRTGRAKLVGMKTAGAVLAGSVTPIDDKCSVYIAVLDGTMGGERLEGVGVAPDIEIDNTTHDQAGYEKQLSVARDALIELMKQPSGGNKPVQ
jgi:carboxyl-terminal processing protease